MTPPTRPYTDEPAHGVCVNTEWFSFVIGRLWALEKEEFWESDGYTASQEMTKMIDEWNAYLCGEPE